MMAALDGELDPGAQRQLEGELEAHADLMEEFKDMKTQQLLLRKQRFPDPPPCVWESYWDNVYRRCERSLGWVLLSAGALLLLLGGGYALVKDWLLDPSVPLWVRVGSASAGVGLLILLVSVIREKLFLHTKERYKDIKL